jgi:hypothetical protein
MNPVIVSYLVLTVFIFCSFLGQVVLLPLVGVASRD